MSRKESNSPRKRHHYSDTLLGVFNKIFAEPTDKRGKLERSMIDTTHLRRTAQAQAL